MRIDDKWLDKLNLLAEDKNEVTEQIIQQFAYSELPNAYFVKQFSEIGQKPYCQKKYWRSFARILIKRGAERVFDVYQDMLIWLKDINWPGSVEVYLFVTENLVAFKYAFKDCLRIAVNTADEAWLNTLIAVMRKSKSLCKLELCKKFDDINDFNWTKIENLYEQWVASI